MAFRRQRGGVERHESNEEKETVEKGYGHSGLDGGLGGLKRVSEHAQATIVMHECAWCVLITLTSLAT